MSILRLFALISALLMPSMAITDSAKRFGSWVASTGVNPMTDIPVALIAVQSNNSFFAHGDEVGTFAVMMMDCPDGLLHVASPVPFYIEGRDCMSNGNCFKFQKVRFKLDKEEPWESRLAAFVDQPSDNKLGMIDHESLIKDFKRGYIFKVEVAPAAPYKAPQVLEFNLSGFSKAYSWCQSL